MDHQADGSRDESLAARLRREGLRDFHEQRMWQDIVNGAKVEEAGELAKQIVSDVLARSPLASWFPDVEWRPFAVVTENVPDHEPYHYPEWTPAPPPEPALWRNSMIGSPVGVVVVPAGPDPFHLLLIGRVITPRPRSIDVEVMLCDRFDRVLSSAGIGPVWSPTININGPARLAQALAAPERWPQPPLRTPKYGWNLDPRP